MCVIEPIDVGDSPTDTPPPILTPDTQALGDNSVATPQGGWGRGWGGTKANFIEYNLQNNIVDLLLVDQVSYTLKNND